MTVAQEIALFFVGQSIVIVGAIIVAFVRTQVALAKLEIRCSHIESNTEELKGDHSALRDQVGGISRHVAALEAAAQKL